MAISLAAHRDRKTANLKLPSKEFIKKYKWWLVAGLAIGLIAFMYFKNKSGSSASSSNTGTGATDTTGTGTTGTSAIPATTLDSGSSGGSSGSSTVTGTPSTSPTPTPQVTTPATTPATQPAASIPGTPAAHTLPKQTTVNPPVVKPVTPIKTAHLLPVRTQPANKRLGFPYAVKGRVNT